MSLTLPGFDDDNDIDDIDKISENEVQYTLKTTVGLAAHGSSVDTLCHNCHFLSQVLVVQTDY